MDGDRLVVAVVALTALFAFGVTAANVDGVTAERGPPAVDDAENADQSGPPQPPENPGGCLVGGGGARSLLSGLGAGLSATSLAGLGLVALLVLAGIWAAVSGWRGEAGEDLPAAPPPVEAPETESAAGERTLPTDVEATNEVYRAWRDLAQSVGGDDEGALTPQEYAAAARRRGYDETAVATLTDVFRRVRYGRAAPTGERERRAREAVEAVLDGDGGDRATNGPEDERGAESERDADGRGEGEG